MVRSSRPDCQPSGRPVRDAVVRDRPLGRTGGRAALGLGGGRPARDRTALEPAPRPVQAAAPEAIRVSALQQRNGTEHRGFTAISKPLGGRGIEEPRPGGLCEVRESAPEAGVVEQRNDGCRHACSNGRPPSAARHHLLR